MTAVRFRLGSNAFTAYRLVLVVIILVTTIGLTVRQQLPPTNYDESKVGPTFSRSTRLQQWPAGKHAEHRVKHRRQEVLELFTENVFGRSPQPPKTLNTSGIRTGRRCRQGNLQAGTIHFSAKPDGPAEVLIHSHRPAPTGSVFPMSSMAIRLRQTIRRSSQPECKDS
jgi:hypothetical protein